MFALSTLLFREGDRGVMLLFKNAETGVEISEALCDVGVALSSRRPPFRAAKGVVTCEGLELAIRGVRSAFFAVVALNVGVASLVTPLLTFCLSWAGITLSFLVPE